MPVPNVEQIKQRVAAAKKAIGGLGESPDPAKARALRKRTRRLQRKRRRFEREAARKAAKPEGDAAQASPE